MINETKSINHLHIGNDVIDITGRFVYRKFEPFEQTDEQLSKTPHWVKPGKLYPVVYDDSSTENIQESNVPRYIELSWTGNPITDIGLREMIESVNLDDLMQGTNIFFNSDLQQEAVIYSSKEQEDLQFQDAKISDNVTEKNKIEYLLSQVDSSSFTESIEKDLNFGGGSQIPVLENTTNKPVQKVSRNEKIAPPDILINSRVASSVMSASYRSPFTGESLFNQLGVAESLSKKINSYENGVTFNNLKETFSKSRNKNSEGFPIHSSNVDTNIQKKLSSGFELLGYVILKYKMNQGEKSYMYTRFVSGHEYRDPYVAYGKIYHYEIRPVYGIYWTKAKNIFIIASDESVVIDIECTELKLPSPPSNLSFSYEGAEKVKVSWSKPSSFVEDDGTLFDSADIKGYQIFSRNSVLEPYTLLKYFKFNNTVPAKYRIYAKENIPDSHVVNYEDPNPPQTDSNGAPVYYEPGNWVLNIRSNVDYFFTMCSIDAHGNSSNYGTQYKVRRNNVTGEVEIKAISPEGAPKQYPNLLIPGELVEPVMKVSGYENIDIYYNPDTKYSKPNVSTGAASFNLHLFELETQTEKNIKIQIDESTN